jgi:psiF repeat
MHKLIALVFLGLSIAAAPAAFAGPQQEKMKMCSKEAKAKGLKKAERKAFMKECLSKKHKMPAKTEAPAGAQPAMEGGGK